MINTTTIKVWYKLNDYDIDIVDIAEGSVVSDLQGAIKNRRSNALANADPPDLEVRTADDKLQLDVSIPTDTTSEKPLFVVVAPELLTRRTESKLEETLTSATNALTQLAAKQEETTNALKLLAAEQKATKIKSAKAVGDYFAVNRSIWEKNRIKVDGAAKEAAQLITKKINEWNAPFRGLCKMPPIEEIKKQQVLEFERLQERDSNAKAATASPPVLPMPSDKVSSAATDKVSSAATDKGVAQSRRDRNKVVAKPQDDILPVPDPNWRLKKTRNQIYEKSPMNAKAQNIFRTSATASRKDASPSFNSLAHAAPIDMACSVFWGPFLELLTGEEGTDSERFFAINGLWKTRCNFGDDFHYHGIKNIPQNLLALPPNHGTVFDGISSGNLIIIPIVDLQSSACDPPQKYGINSHFDLLVIAKSKSVYHWIYNGDAPGAVNIYAESIDAGVEEASALDVQIATNFLELYVKAAAHIGLSSMQSKLNQEERVFEKMYATAHQNKVDDNANADQRTVFSKTLKNKDGFRNNLEKAKAALEQIDSKGVWVPTLANNFVFKNNNVLKVKLKTYFDDCSIPLKYYPSWSMLGLKASANWLVFAEQPFIPSCRDIDPEIFPVGFSFDIGSNSVVSSLSPGDTGKESDEDSVMELKPTRGPLSPHQPRSAPAVVTPP